jgi:raffinose/stachyose/melibiose transport system permease protein
MLIPVFLFYFIFRIYPIMQGIYLGFFEWSGISPQKNFVGLSNFINLLYDPQFRLALQNTLVITFTCVAVQLSLGFSLAWLSVKYRKIGRVFQSVALFPYLISLVIVGTIWTWIFDPSIGLLNSLLKGIGLGSLTRAWLGEIGIALLAVLITMNWQGFGLYVILFSVGLGTIPRAIYDSSKVDGLSDFQTAKHIIIPMLKEVFVVGFILIVAASFKTFELIYIMTGGGPAYSTDVLASYLYRSSFEMLKAGYGSAIASYMLIFCILIAIFYIRTVKAKE